MKREIQLNNETKTKIKTIPKTNSQRARMHCSLSRHRMNEKICQRTCMFVCVQIQIHTRIHVHRAYSIDYYELNRNCVDVWI